MRDYKDVDEQIAAEIGIYVTHCRDAAKHNDQENEFKRKAHIVFYHIQELRSTRKISPLNYASR